MDSVTSSWKNSSPTFLGYDKDRTGNERIKGAQRQRHDLISPPTKIFGDTQRDRLRGDVMSLITLIIRGEGVRCTETGYTHRDTQTVNRETAR
jgi:hypothetical protein